MSKYVQKIQKTPLETPVQKKKPKYVQKDQNQIVEPQKPKEVPKQNVQEPSKIQQSTQSKPIVEQSKPKKSKYVEKVQGGQTQIPVKTEEIKKQKIQYEKKYQNKKPIRNKKTQNRGYKQKSGRFNWDPYKITLDTPIPDMPKKLLQKPDGAALDKKIDDIVKKIKSLEAERKDKRQALREEIKNTTFQKKDHKRNFKAMSSKVRDLIQSKLLVRKTFNQLRELQNSIIAKLKNLRKIEKQFENGDLDYQSSATLKQKKQQFEHILITKTLSKQEYRKIKEKINEITRKLVNSKQQIDLDLERQKNLDLINIQQAQMEKISDQIKVVKKQLDEIEKEIKENQQIKQSQEKNAEETRTPAEIREQYENQIEKITDEIYSLQDDIKNLEDNFENDCVQYERQQELIDWIKFAENQKRLIQQQIEFKKKKQQQRRIEEQKRKKQREIQLKQKQRKKQEYEKNKKIREERQKKRQDERKKVLETLPYEEQKRLCKFLISYCEQLVPKENELIQEQKKQKKDIKLKGNQWDKETKKGAHLILSKKEVNTNELLIEKAKKEVAAKKPQRKIEENFLDHHIQIIRLFESFKILPPARINDIKQTITAINSKYQYYANPSQADIKLHRQKMQYQFEHGKRYEEKDNRGTEEKIRTVRNNRKIEPSQFPDLD